MLRSQSHWEDQNGLEAELWNWPHNIGLNLLALPLKRTFWGCEAKMFSQSRLKGVCFAHSALFNITGNSIKSSCIVCMLYRYWSLNHTWTIILHGFCLGELYLANELDIFSSGICGVYVHTVCTPLLICILIYIFFSASINLMNICRRKYLNHGIWHPVHVSSILHFM